MPRRKGISPVIATVIIVAVTIAVAIAVAFWMTGIIGLFTAVEKLEIVSLTVQPQSGGGWSVTIVVKNTGTTPTTIDQIIINNVLAAKLGATGGLETTGNCQGLSGVTADKVRLNPGDQATITLTLSGGQSCGATNLSPGVSIEIKLHSTGGKEYPKLTTLP